MLAIVVVHLHFQFVRHFSFKEALEKGHRFKGILNYLEKKQRDPLTPIKWAEPSP